MFINHKQYAIYHLGISGGKDSTAVLLWLIYESGWDLGRVKITFSDTGNEDPLTYAFIKMLSEQIHQIEVIKPELGFYELAQKKGRFPSLKVRFCTQMLKLHPARDHIRQLMIQHEHVLLLNGVRRDEGHANNNRGEVPEFGWDDSFACNIYRPVLHWSIEDVWAMHKKHLELDAVLSIVDADLNLADAHKDQIIRTMKQHGIPRNPLYDMGAVRVGCYPCIFSRKKEIRAMAKYRPERIDFIEEQENLVHPERASFFFRNTVPERHRSKPIITNEGEELYICTIRDVVRWSKTAYGGKQYEFDLDLDTPATACDITGMCE